MTYKIHGLFNEINTKLIGDNTHIGNFNYIGKNVRIGKNCKIHNFVEIYDDTEIGDNCIINSKCIFNSGTIIGNNVIFGGMVETADERKMFVNHGLKQPCIIEDNVKVGQGARLICCRIGKDSEIGANAVIMNDVPPNEIWVTKAMKAEKIGNVV